MHSRSILFEGDGPFSHIFLSFCTWRYVFPSYGQGQGTREPFCDFYSTCIYISLSCLVRHSMNIYLFLFSIPLLYWFVLSSLASCITVVEWSSEGRFRGRTCIQHVEVHIRTLVWGCTRLYRHIEIASDEAPRSWRRSENEGKVRREPSGM